MLLGRLLNAHDEKAEARAAFSLALWVNPNHLRANMELLPFCTDEESIIASLVRLFGESLRVGGFVGWARRVSSLPLFSYEGLRYGFTVEVRP